ncbi:hypothetical protein ACF0H5_001891 [Mactra antiquata]
MNTHKPKRFREDEKLEVTEIGDGNLNVVLRVSGDNNKSIIVKHSLPYIKCLGEGYPLGEQRIDIEYKALSKFHTLSPGSVPEPYAFDKPNNAVYMEDLHGYKMLRGSLMDGIFDLTLSDTIGRHLGTVHRDTHVSTVGDDGIKTLTEEFDNSNMVVLHEEFVFTRPLNRTDPTNKCSTEVSKRLDSLYDDERVVAAINAMLDVFKTKKECLLHGDLHTGSIMFSGSDIRLMDIEFAHIGAASFDVGILVAHFIFSYFRHMSLDDTHKNFAYMMVDACKRFVSTYLQYMTAYTGDRKTYIKNFMSETAGFAGCEIVRRCVGAAHNADVEDLPDAEVDCLGAGVRLLHVYQKIHDIDRLLVIAFMLTI